MKSWFWGLSLVIHLVLIALAGLQWNPLVKSPAATRISLSLEAPSKNTSLARSSGGRLESRFFPGTYLSDGGWTASKAPGEFEFFQDSQTTASPQESWGGSFRNSVSDELLLEPLENWEASAQVYWESGSDTQPELDSLDLEGLFIPRSLEIKWTGKVLPEGGWDQSPRVSPSDNPELDLRLNQWLRKLEPPFNPGPDPMEVTLVFSVKLRRPL